MCNYQLCVCACPEIPGSHKATFFLCSLRICLFTQAKQKGRVDGQVNGRGTLHSPIGEFHRS